MTIQLINNGLSKTILFLGVLSILGQTRLLAQASTGWKGTGPDAFWSTAANWTNGVPNTSTNAQSSPARILNFGPTGNIQPSSTNDINNVSGYRIFFNSGATNYTLYLKAGTGGTVLNDFSQNQPQIQNDSTLVQTVDMAFKMQARGITIAANQAANINPTAGDLVFTPNCTITLITNTQLHFFSSVGRSASFYGPLLQSQGVSNGLALLTTGSGGIGATVVFYNTNSCSNSVINCGTLRLATNNVTVNPILLGDTASTVAPPAFLQMDNGFSNSSPLVIQFPQPALTNSKIIGNTSVGSGTALFTGPVSLGTNLTLLANAARLLELDGNFDFQNPTGAGPRVLTVSGPGNTLITGSFINATTGSSVLTKTNAGTLTIAGTGNAVRILYNLGGGVISLTNAAAIGIPTGANYPDKFNFTASATLSVTNSFTLGRNAGPADNAGFRISGGNTGTFDVAANSTLTLDGPVIDLPGTGAGSLAKTSAGALVLQQSNTYSGSTIINAGRFALAGGGSISNSANIIVSAAAAFDVSALGAAFNLAAGQTLSNSTSTATLIGNLNSSAGKISLTFAAGSPAFSVTNGTLTLSAATVFQVNNTGAALGSGSYKIISALAGGAVAGSLPAVTVNGGGATAAVSLRIIGGELYLNVNHAPVAGLMTVTRNAGIPTYKIAFSDLATNWTDADGDTISLVAVGVSTNGITLSTNGGFLIYSNGSNVNDQFSYLITDSQGATATGVVNVVVNHSVTGQIQSFAVISGAPTLAFAGIPAYTYTIQRSTNLPVWVSIWTTNAPANGLFDYTDNFNDLGVTPASAFYRLSY